MKKSILFIFFSLISFFSISQVEKWDTVIYKGGYASYFSYEHRNPVMLVYKLYKGGGPCKRDGFRFKNDLKIPAASTEDYLKSGFDKGHLANAEDFAYDCRLDELTFRYYNCVPQRPELNRGIWKTTEEEIRKISQTDSLLIVCINQFGPNCTKMGKGVSIPQNCIKIAASLSTGKIYICRSFVNSRTPSQKDLPQDYLDKTAKLVLADLKRNLHILPH